MTTKEVQPEAQQSPRDYARLQTVLSDACQHLLAEQQLDGTWHGAIMYNAWTNGMYCILQRLLGADREPTAALNWLEANRTGHDEDGEPNGTWGIIDTPSLNFLEGTIVAEIALEIWGRGRRQEPWTFISEQASGRLSSGLSLADPFTQTFAVLANPYAPPGYGPYHDMAGILAAPLELLLVPRFVRSSVPRLAGAWGQDALVGLMVMTTVGSGRKLNPLERVLLKKAEAQLLTNQNEDGSWYDTFLPTIAGTIAMYLLGYGPETEVMRKALSFLHGLQRADGYVSRYKLPVWDTTIAMLALTSAGVDPAAVPLRRAGHYLLSCQGPDGGVPFQRENVRYPDTDDAAFAILALNRVDMGVREEEKARVIARALRWLHFMQGSDGGWAAFAKDQARAVRGLLPVFKDDPPTADVVGHVLSALALGASGDTETTVDRVARGVSWLESMQLDNGSWFGRWGLTFTYGTAAVLSGLRDVRHLGPNARIAANVIDEATEYLLRTQQNDGGWGEDYVTYFDFTAPNNAVSTVEQTAWTVSGLLAVRQTPEVSQAIERGIDFLLEQYDPERGWPEASYTVGAIWVYRNSLYPLLWGVWALAEYAKVKSPAAGVPSSRAPRASSSATRRSSRSKSGGRRGPEQAALDQDAGDESLRGSDSDAREQRSEEPEEDQWLHHAEDDEEDRVAQHRAQLPAENNDDRRLPTAWEATDDE